ncbi:hypothetical protein GDO86_015319 [Hymenochirus boettgeri]|uniref:Uncharacterized protein n=1 Tax=Hymenochirus boettgeri TaxID=247094 RepID=A0A8T2K0K5_9PIPI|nr:hypothetical protein GDO86_015319 [Hymenochirus boettgeri]
MPTTQLSSMSKLMGSSPQALTTYFVDPKNVQGDASKMVCAIQHVCSSPFTFSTKINKDLTPISKTVNGSSILQQWNANTRHQESPMQYRSFFMAECEDIARQIQNIEEGNTSKRKAEQLDISTIEAEPPPFYCTPKSVLRDSESSAKRRRLDFLDYSGKEKSKYHEHYFDSPLTSLCSNWKDTIPIPCIGIEETNPNGKNVSKLRPFSKLEVDLTCANFSVFRGKDSLTKITPSTQRYSTPMKPTVKPIKNLSVIQELEYEPNISEEWTITDGACGTDMQCKNALYLTYRCQESLLQTPQLKSICEIDNKEMSYCITRDGEKKHQSVCLDFEKMLMADHVNNSKNGMPETVFLENNEINLHPQPLERIVAHYSNIIKNITPLDNALKPKQKISEVLNKTVTLTEELKKDCIREQDLIALPKTQHASQIIPPVNFNGALDISVANRATPGFLEINEGAANITHDLISINCELALNNATQVMGFIECGLDAAKATYEDAMTPMNDTQDTMSMSSKMCGINVTQDLVPVLPKVTANITHTIQRMDTSICEATINVTQEMMPMQGNAVTSNGLQKIVFDNGGLQGGWNRQCEINEAISSHVIIPKLSIGYKANAMELTHTVLDRLNSANITKDIVVVDNMVTTVNKHSEVCDGRIPNKMSRPPEESNKKLILNKGSLLSKRRKEMEKNRSKKCIVPDSSVLVNNEVYTSNFNRFMSDTVIVGHRGLDQDTETIQDSSIFTGGSHSFVTSTPVPGFNNCQFIRKSSGNASQGDFKLPLSVVAHPKTKVTIEKQVNKQVLLNKGFQETASHGCLIPRFTRKGMPPSVLETTRLLQTSAGNSTQSKPETAKDLKLKISAEVQQNSQTPQKIKTVSHISKPSAQVIRPINHLKTSSKTPMVVTYDVPQPKSILSIKTSAISVPKFPVGSSLVRPPSHLRVPSSGKFCFGPSSTSSILQKAACGISSGNPSAITGIPIRRVYGAVSKGHNNGLE